MNENAPGKAYGICRNCGEEVRWVYSDKRWLTTKDNGRLCPGQPNGHKPSPKR